MLAAKNIFKTYYNGNKSVPVLKGVDLEIEKGKFVAMVGPSGAGKSTLLHILGGLDSPTQGQVFFQKEDLYKLSDAFLSKIRNSKIGFVFQFYHLLAEFTVLENVLLPALIAGPRFKSSELRNNALQLLAHVGLKERITHFPNQLSGGERQRVALARALINRPDLLLCDEPTGNLDSKTGNEIITLIKKINHESQMTVVVVTHNIELAQAADKVYQLRDGILVN